MLISDSTVQKVKSLNILDVVRRYLPALKTKGNKHEACCPFHDENSPSFTVNDRRQIYKCFGCGAAGDVVQFVMQYRRLTFPEAVKELATENSIGIEMEVEDPAQAQQSQQERLQREAVLIALEFAASWFLANDLPTDFIKMRKLSPGTLQTFRDGYAPAAPRRFYEDALRQGFSAEVLEQAGLVRKHQPEGVATPQYFDFFQDRVMLPICDARGRVVAFTGRLQTEPTADAKYKPGKYVNSPDSVWTKGDHLYGLDIADKAIRRLKFAYLVEGNLDVQQMHEKGLTNTVASCGTALTENQIKLLKRYTSHVVVVPDTDKAGLAALHKSSELLIEAGFRVEVLVPVATKKDTKTDADEFLRRKCHTPKDVDEWVATRRDYVTSYLLAECLQDSDLGPHEKAQAMQRIGAVIEKIPNDMLRGSYHSSVAEAWPDFKKHVKPVKRTEDVAKRVLENLDEEERDEISTFKFFEKNNCYYTIEGGSKSVREVRICGFTINVLYFVGGKEDSKWVCRFTNMKGKTRVAAVSTDDFSAATGFKKTVARLGNFIWEGSDDHLNQIKYRKFDEAPEAEAINYMGYHNTGGFTTWANGLLHNKQFVEADKYGIVQLPRTLAALDDVRALAPESHVEVAGQRHVLQSNKSFIEQMGEENLVQMLEQGRVQELRYYYLPFASKLKLFAEDDDRFEQHHRYFHDQKPGLTFADWSQLLLKAYGDNGRVMIAFYVAAIFRDIVFKANNSYFPLLFNYGPRGVGKTQAAGKLAVMFGKELDKPQNLEGGLTTTAMQRLLDIMSNGLLFFDEYKNHLSMQMIGTLKGIAGGMSKTQGRATGGNETKSYKVRSAAMVCGQDLPTKDPALLSRCILCEYSEELLRQNDSQAYHRLSELNEEGLLTSVTSEVIGYRDYILAYRKRAPEVSREVREKCEELLGEQPEERTALNVVSLLTPVKLLMEAGLEFPFTYEEMLKLMVSRINLQRMIQASTDDVEQYFQVLITLIIRGEIQEGMHYKLQRETDGVTKLFLRVRMVDGLYQSEARRQSEVVGLSSATVRTYLKQSRFFVRDAKRGVMFEHMKGNETSAMVFNYDLMRDAGIEFPTSIALDDMEAADDPSLKAATTVALTPGTTPELIREFIDEQRMGNYTVHELLRRFNVGKAPQLTQAQFVEYLKNYAGSRHRLAVDFSSDWERLTLKTPF
ncbi:DNA primase [Hymenobacter sp. BT491]|uniref:DNA primase n=1 Tax=Hymenobacter sp. BT491 TaxID=2766779 RepID=UPI001653AF66|nr:DNA primase [Hymenobacter sp. BT491]MBC6988552.1 DNA primase [Hymenobacter sp. BT491]